MTVRIMVSWQRQIKSAARSDCFILPFFIFCISRLNQFEHMSIYYAKQPHASSDQPADPSLPP